MTELTGSATDRLYTEFRGQLISPGDDEYDAARRVWNGAIDRRPALIARPSGTRDVATAVRFAREQHLPVSVRGGGHSAAGHAVADGALTLDLSGMKSILIDPATRTAVAGPGLVWRELDAATQAYGLATTGGVDGTTGIAGLTLGGGLGWLDRLAGLACDNLLGAEVVTADGQVLEASTDDHSDLFWALRGGGGNFGVVTSLTYRLHPVTEVYGGLLGYTVDRATEVLQAYREIGADAPDRLALYAGLVTAPAAPFVPEHLRGQRVVGLIPVCFGPAAEAARTLAPLLAAAPPVLDLTKPMSYQEVQRLADGFTRPAMHHYYTSEWLHGLDDQTIDELVATAADAPSPWSAIILKRMTGAAGRVPADATPFWYRDAAYRGVTQQLAGQPGQHPGPGGIIAGPPGGRLQQPDQVRVDVEEGSPGGRSQREMDHRVLVFGQASQVPREPACHSRQAPRRQPQRVTRPRVQLPHRRGEVLFAQASQADLWPQSQGRSRSGDHRRGRRGTPGGDDRQHLDGIWAAAVDVVDDDQPGRARHQKAGRAVQIQPPRVAVHQADRQVIGCPRIAEQLCPHQPPRLAPGRRRPQHLKPAMASLADRRLRHGRLARPSRADQNQHATRAVRGAVQQAADRRQLQAPPGGERVSRMLHPVVRSSFTPTLQRSGFAAGTASGPCALAGRLASGRLLRFGKPYPRYLGVDRRRFGRRGLAWSGLDPDLDLSHGCSFR